MRNCSKIWQGISNLGLLCQNSLFLKSSQNYPPTLWHLCHPPWLFNRGWPVLSPPPHTCKLISPQCSLVITWAWTPQSLSLSESRTLATFFQVLAVWSTFPLKETQKHIEHTPVCSGIGLPTQQRPYSFILFAPTAKKISFCCSFWVLFVREWGGYIWFHWALICFGMLLQTPAPSPASALLTPRFQHHTFSCASLAWHPSFHMVHTFLMYPLPSRHLHMLIITKADVLKYPYSRANIHKPFWDSWWVQVSTYASLVREPLWGC